MIKFEKLILENGLVVITHQDTTTPMAAVNVLYKVGSKHEQEDHTGFAHLFEHLMFSGSANVSDFDTVIQEAGGENNAYTNNDYTNYYDILPAHNIESALWVEADRMANLILSDQKLDVQRRVVIEEFKEVCLNTPYGDVWHHLSSLSYKAHPYSWPTIGKVPEHIEKATIQNVQLFFDEFYNPGNAILSIASPLSHNRMQELARKWFGEIEDAKTTERSIPRESVQKGKRKSVIHSEVPLRALFMAFHMPERLSRKYYASDLLSDLLASGKSSRFYQNLINQNQLFSHLDAYISGTFDPGLFMIDSKPMPGVSLELASEKIWEQLDLIKNGNINESELTKVKNKLTTELILSDLDILNKTMILAYFEALGDADYANRQLNEYTSVTRDEIIEVANEILIEENLNELVYLPIEK